MIDFLAYNTWARTKRRPGPPHEQLQNAALDGNRAKLDERYPDGFPMVGSALRGRGGG